MLTHLVARLTHFSALTIPIRVSPTSTNSSGKNCFIPVLQGKTVLSPLFRGKKLFYSNPLGEIALSPTYCGKLLYSNYLDLKLCYPNSSGKTVLFQLFAKDFGEKLFYVHFLYFVCTIYDAKSNSSDRESNMFSSSSKTFNFK